MAEDVYSRQPLGSLLISLSSINGLRFPDFKLRSFPLFWTIDKGRSMNLQGYISRIRKLKDVTNTIVK